MFLRNESTFCGWPWWLYVDFWMSAPDRCQSEWEDWGGPFFSPSPMFPDQTSCSNRIFSCYTQHSCLQDFLIIISHSKSHSFGLVLDFQLPWGYLKAAIRWTNGSPRWSSVLECLSSMCNAVCLFPAPPNPDQNIVYTIQSKTNNPRSDTMNTCIAAGDVAQC